MKININTYPIEGTREDIKEMEILYDTLNDYLSRGINYPGWIKEIYPVRQTAEEAIEESSLFVLKKNGLIAGSIILNHKPETAYEGANWNIEAGNQEVMVVRTLVTHPQFMRQGVARRLMTFAKEYAESYVCGLSDWMFPLTMILLLNCMSSWDIAILELLIWDCLMSI